MDEGKSSIAEMILETVSNHFWDTVLPGFHFSDEYQMFYNPESGYYYDQNSSLFYHPSTRCYYVFDDKTGGFVFYSRVPSENCWKSERIKQQAVLLYGESYVNGMDQDEVDVFELLYNLVHLVCYNMGEEQAEETQNSEVMDEITQFIEEERIRYPPCIRMMDQKGVLHVVTISGAKIGFGSDCDVQLNRCSDSVLASKTVVAEVCYIEGTGFMIKPLSSEVPVLLKGSIAAEEGTILQHNDECTIASSSFRIHIHHGSNTCNGCEPGVVVAPETPSVSVDRVSALTGERLRRRNLRALKAEYGLLGDMRSEEFQKKRQFYGQTDASSSKASRPMFQASNPYSGTIYSHCLAKPLSANAEVSRQGRQILENNEGDNTNKLSSDNKGYKLLRNLGWSEGTSLGKNDSGIKQPVIAQVKRDRGGLGFNGSTAEQPRSEKSRILEITRLRYNSACEQDR